MYNHHSHVKLQRFGEDVSYRCAPLGRRSLRRHELMSKHDFHTQHIHPTPAGLKMWRAAERTHIFQQREQPGINRSQVVGKSQALAKLYK